MNQRMLARKPANASVDTQHTTSGLKLSKPGDTFEQDADRVADAVVSGGPVPSWSIAKVGAGANTVQRDTPDGPGQPQQTPKPNNYDEAALKLLEAFLKTDAGKKFLESVEKDPLVKDAKDFVSSTPGIVVSGTAAAGAIAGLAAAHKPLPVQIPAVPLDKVIPALKGVKAQINVQGPLDHPTQFTIGFSGTFGGESDKKKKKDDPSARIAKEKQAIQSSLDMFKPKGQGGDDVAELLKLGKGAATPGFEDFGARRSPTPLPGTQGTPLAPLQQPSPQQPVSGVQLPGLGVPFRPKTLQLLDKQLELKPLDAPQAHGSKDQDKKEEIPVQRKASGLEPARAGEGEVEEGLRSTSESLDAETRSSMESRIGHDFSKVKIHTGESASLSARSLGALAYTVGENIVFDAGRYSPRSTEGRRLLAHELTHVVQQENAAAISGNSHLTLGAIDHSSEREADSVARIAGSGWSLGASGVGIASRKSQPVVQCAPAGWSSDYDEEKSSVPLSHSAKPYEQFKAGLGEIRPTTKGGLSQNLERPIKKYSGTGTKAAPEITMPVLKKIYPALAADVAADPAKEGQAKAYLDSLNQAFRIMKIDSVEAQADYLAHAFVESGQFRAFTESQAGVDKGAHTWVDDPTQVPLNKAALPKDKDVNPHGNFEFIGRGPVQVTHQSEYVETIAMLEKTAEQYDKDAKAGDVKAMASAQMAREAAAAIKADPRQAANPKYAFLFSAAFMKKSAADVKVAFRPKEGPEWVGDDPKSSWVAGGKQKAGSPQAGALVEKGKAYDHIYKTLMEEAKKASTSAP